MRLGKVKALQSGRCNWCWWAQGRWSRVGSEKAAWPEEGARRRRRVTCYDMCGRNLSMWECMHKGDCYITVCKKIELEITCMYINKGLVKKLCCICSLGYEFELVPVPARRDVPDTWREEVSHVVKCQVYLCVCMCFLPVLKAICNAWPWLTQATRTGLNLFGLSQPNPR